MKDIENNTIAMLGGGGSFMISVCIEWKNLLSSQKTKFALELQVACWMSRLRYNMDQPSSDWLRAL